MSLNRKSRKKPKEINQNLPLSLNQESYELKQMNLNKITSDAATNTESQSSSKIRQSSEERKTQAFKNFFEKINQNQQTHSQTTKQDKLLKKENFEIELKQINNQQRSHSNNRIKKSNQAIDRIFKKSKNLLLSTEDEENENLLKSLRLDRSSDRSSSSSSVQLCDFNQIKENKQKLKSNKQLKKKTSLDKSHNPNVNFNNRSNTNTINSRTNEYCKYCKNKHVKQNDFKKYRNKCNCEHHSNYNINQNNNISSDDECEFLNCCCFKWFGS
jgi:hypothetical protein